MRDCGPNGQPNVAITNSELFGERTSNVLNGGRQGLSVGESRVTFPAAMLGPGRHGAPGALLEFRPHVGSHRPRNVISPILSSFFISSFSSS